jgi:putative ABC transport system permease protein
VEGVALQSLPPMGFGLWFSPFRYGGQSPVEINASVKPGTSDFIPFYDFQLIAGRNIADTDTLYEVVINQRFAKELGVSSPADAVGQLLNYNGKNYPIVGVVADFHEQSFHEPMSPAIIGNFSFPVRSIAVKVPAYDDDHFDRKELLMEIEKVYKQVFPDETFNANLMEDEIGWMHERDQRTATLVTVSMLITILISTMGIFGLSMFTCEMRLKEIGIRKVLGASVTSIAALLSREFIVLIFIAVLVTIPISWYLIGNWLAEFNYHIDLTFWTYIISAGIALAIGLLVISFRTISAALTNPVEILKSE